LQRTGQTGSLVDNLVYQYLNNTNRLLNVTDSANQAIFAKTAAFAYDPNGNMLNGDGASNVVYDSRNLPLFLQKDGKTAEYRYNAAGQRIYKKVYGATANTEEHYLMNGTQTLGVYKSGQLQYWETEFGKYEKVNSSVYSTSYYIKDHLGSTRVVLREDMIRTEATDYYAFGLKMEGRSYSMGSANKAGFTGKERDIETGWDYFGARYYMSHLGRWNGVDALAEQYPSTTPFGYVSNNPLNIIDPNGMEERENCAISRCSYDSFTIVGVVSFGAEGGGGRKKNNANEQVLACNNNQGGCDEMDGEAVEGGTGASGGEQESGNSSALSPPGNNIIEGSRADIPLGALTVVGSSEQVAKLTGIIETLNQSPLFMATLYNILIHGVSVDVMLVEPDKKEAADGTVEVPNGSMEPTETRTVIHKVRSGLNPTVPWYTTSIRVEYTKAVIRINPSIPLETQLETMAHEVRHAEQRLYTPISEWDASYPSQFPNRQAYDNHWMEIDARKHAAEVMGELPKKRKQ
jgi:RHS repeat-associated protein